MKKKVLSVVIAMLPFLGFSQMGGSVVFDPTQAANMSTQISNTATQITQLEKSLEYMQKASDVLEQVNGHLRDIEELKKITKLYKESISIAEKVRLRVGKIQNKETQKRYIVVISSSLASIQSSLSFINKLLSSNYFKMSDKDRMDLIKAEKHKILLKRSKLKGLILF